MSKNPLPPASSMSDDKKAQEPPTLFSAMLRGRITRLRKLKFVMFLRVKLEMSEDALAVKVLLCSDDNNHQQICQRFEASNSDSSSGHCCSFSVADFPLHFRMKNKWDFHQARVELRPGDMVQLIATRAEEARHNDPFYKAVCVSLISRWKDDFPGKDFFRSSHVFNNTKNEGLQSSSLIPTHCTHWLASQHCTVINCKFLHANPKSSEFIEARRKEYDKKKKLRLCKMQKAQVHGPLASKDKRAVEFVQFLMTE